MAIRILIYSKILYIIIIFNLTTNINAELVHFKPSNSRYDKFKYSSDILSHSNRNYNPTDLVNKFHELSHFCNSEVSNKFAPKRGVYIFNNQAYIYKEPRNLTLAYIAKKIPNKYRGQIYKLTFITMQRDWNRRTSYLIDELVAYQNGTIVGENLKVGFRIHDSMKRCLEINIYAIYLKRLARQQDITECVNFLTKRNLILYKRVNKTAKSPEIIHNSMKHQYKLLLKVIKNEN